MGQFFKIAIMSNSNGDFFPTSPQWYNASVKEEVAMKCPNCGKKIKTSSALIQNITIRCKCGTRVTVASEERQSQPAKDLMMFCTECGQELPKESKYCKKCGANLSK